MGRNHRRHRADLKTIARRAMVDRGLLPDFSEAVMAEVRRSTSPAIEDDPQIRDLRGLLWASIDNDDSEDLDQLTLADPLPGYRTRIHRLFQNRMKTGNQGLPVPRGNRSFYKQGFVIL